MSNAAEEEEEGEGGRGFGRYETCHLNFTHWERAKEGTRDGSWNGMKPLLSAPISDLKKDKMSHQRWHAIDAASHSQINCNGWHRMPRESYRS